MVLVSKGNLQDFILRAKLLLLKTINKALRVLMGAAV